jgi:hypothetical protein
MSEKPNDQEQQQIDGVDIPGDEAPQPVVVDVEGGTAEETPAAATPPAEGEQPPARQAKPRPQARIQTLTHERDEARNYAAQMQRELEEARRAAAEAQAARAQAERSGMENYGARVKSDISSAERELIAAKEAGDSAAEVAAQKKLAKAAAAEVDYDAWATQQPKPGEQPPQRQQQEQPRQQQQQPQQEVVPDEATLEFLDQNRWFDAFERAADGSIAVDRAGRPIQNPDFDEDLHDAAMLVHKRIARQVKTGSKPKDYIGSPEYFQEVSSGVAQAMPDAFGDEPAPPPPTRRTPPMSQTRQPVAPANRSAPNNTNGSGKQGAGKVTLDGEQAAFVRSLVDNGTLKYSVKHPDPNKRGQKMDYKDAYVEYAKRSTADQADKANGNRQ